METPATPVTPPTQRPIKKPWHFVVPTLQLYLIAVTVPLALKWLGAYVPKGPFRLSLEFLEPTSYFVVPPLVVWAAYRRIWRQGLAAEPYLPGIKRFRTFLMGSVTWCTVMGLLGDAQRSLSLALVPVITLRSPAELVGMRQPVDAFYRLPQAFAARDLTLSQVSDTLFQHAERPRSDGSLYAVVGREYFLKMVCPVVAGPHDPDLQTGGVRCWLVEIGGYGPSKEGNDNLPTRRNAGRVLQQMRAEGLAQPRWWKNVVVHRRPVPPGDFVRNSALFPADGNAVFVEVVDAPQQQAWQAAGGAGYVLLWGMLALLVLASWPVIQFGLGSLSVPPVNRPDNPSLS